MRRISGLLLAAVGATSCGGGGGTDVVVAAALLKLYGALSVGRILEDQTRDPRFYWSYDRGQLTDWSSSTSPRTVAMGVRISWATRAAIPPRNASWSARRISSRILRFSEASRKRRISAVDSRRHSRCCTVTSRRISRPVAVTTDTSPS